MLGINLVIIFFVVAIVLLLIQFFYAISVIKKQQKFEENRVRQVEDELREQEKRATELIGKVNAQRDGFLTAIKTAQAKLQEINNQPTDNPTPKTDT